MNIGSLRFMLKQFMLKRTFFKFQVGRGEHRMNGLKYKSSKNICLESYLSAIWFSAKNLQNWSKDYGSFACTHLPHNDLLLFTFCMYNSIDRRHILRKDRNSAFECT